MYSLSTSPQSIGKVLDSGFKLFTSSFGGSAVLAFFAGVAIALPNILFMSNAASDPLAATEMMGSFFVSFAIGMVVFLALYNAMFYRIGAISKGGSATIGESIGVGLRKIIPIILAGICYMLAVMVGSILLLIPGIILMLSMVFYMPLIVCENEGIISSLKVSHGLVWGNWWRTMAVFLAPIFVYMVVYMGAVMIAGIAFGSAAAMGDPSGAAATVNLAVNVITVLISIFIYPFFAAIMLVQLNDLKLRKHGSDLEQRVGA